MFVGKSNAGEYPEVDYKNFGSAKKKFRPFTNKFLWLNLILEIIKASRKLFV